MIFQGNLIPLNLVGGKEMREEIINIKQDMKEKNFIFNLGHGIYKDSSRKCKRMYRYSEKF